MRQNSWLHGVWLRIKESDNARRLRTHFADFPYIWCAIGLVFVAAFLCIFSKTSTASWSWHLVKGVVYISVLIILAIFLLRPMNAVYGLMGTSGSIRLFFFNFLFITALFACIYHWAFFKDAGISYDVNQPHIDYQLFKNDNQDGTIRIVEKRDTMLFERQLDTISYRESVVHITRDTLHYQRIDFMQVWRSSILTTLTQEPAELLTSASIHNSGMDSSNIGLDKQKSILFEWILILHIIISWIFFGVFISLLYNKFRYES